MANTHKVVAVYTSRSKYKLDITEVTTPLGIVYDYNLLSNGKGVSGGCSIAKTLDDAIKYIAWMIPDYKLHRIS